MKHIRTTLKHPKKYRTKNYIQHKSTQKINIDILSSLSHCPFYDQSRADTRVQKHFSPCPSTRTFKKDCPTLIPDVSKECLASKCIWKFPELYSEQISRQNNDLDKLGPSVAVKLCVLVFRICDTKNYPNESDGDFYTGI